jgi:hypothetical protein
MRRFQFTIHDMLWAMFWAAVSSSFWGLAYRSTELAMSGHQLVRVTMVFSILAGYVTACAAIGALFDKTLPALALGWSTGVACLVLYFVVWVMAGGH